MYNDYILVGPKSDPSFLKNNISIESALEKFTTMNFFLYQEEMIAEQIKRTKSLEKD